MFRAILYSVVFFINLAVYAKTGSARIRQIVLLASGYVLYCSWSIWFAPVLLASTIANFLFGNWLRRKTSPLILTAGILLNVILLSAFKYLPPIASDLPFPSLQKFAQLALPLGISFWTFQAMSYLFDLYRGEELDPSFVEFALYMSFFPVTISGPICRLPEMLPQFRVLALRRLTTASRGFCRIGTGILMMQLARLLGQGIFSGDGIVRGFDRATVWTGPDVWCLAIGYGLQLFFDFAGYSHIAIGAAQALGFTVPENFDRPFASTTPSIFWTRWHMSLSFWIRDYLFFPLATMRREIWWRNFVLAFSMVIFGLWHQATILFILWGLYHGILLVGHRQIQQAERRLNWNPSILWSPLSWFVTLTSVSLGWILFRANNLQQARKMFAAVLSPATYWSHFLSGSLYALVIALALCYAGTVFVSDSINKCLSAAESPADSRGMLTAFARSRWYWLPPLYALALIVIFLVTHTREAGAAQFMYRRF